MLLKASKRVIENKDKINAINVFPVADSDTGSNLASTLLGVKQILENKTFKSSLNLVDEVLKSAFENSQGNSGMMMASYLKGFLNSLKRKNKFLLLDLSNSANIAYESARSSIQKPVRGTMLDVMQEFSSSLLVKRKDISIVDAFYNSAQKVKIALSKTQKKLKVLKENHVVDAGALGFTYFVYGLYEGLSNERLELEVVNSLPKAKMEDSNEFSHEVIFTIQDAQVSVVAIKEIFNPLGESLDIMELKKKIKVHIHTDRPEVVKETAFLTGEIVDIRISKL